MTEKHPYDSFVPKNCKYLFLGTFAAKPEPGYDWFFGTKRNQFWPMMEIVFKRKLDTTEMKKVLFTRLGMAITDIILTCERSEETNADTNLINFTYNTNVINNIIKENDIEKIYFSSRMAEKLFRKVFKETILKYPKIELITLPSPSPRYALITKAEKIIRYKRLLPKIN
jgi:hypoxanthine-DNA glycosylase